MTYEKALVLTSPNLGRETQAVEYTKKLIAEGKEVNFVWTDSWNGSPGTYYHQNLNSSNLEQFLNDYTIKGENAFRTGESSRFFYDVLSACDINNVYLASNHYSYLLQGMRPYIKDLTTIVAEPADASYDGPDGFNAEHVSMMLADHVISANSRVDSILKSRYSGFQHKILPGSNHSPNENGAKVSVVIPTYNRKNLVPLTINSFLNQNTDLPYELIVVDDGSTDGTHEYLSSLYSEQINAGKIKLLSKQNSGPSDSRNLGLENIASTSEVTIFMDSDDLPTSDRIQYAYDFFKLNPDKSVLHGKAVTIDEQGNENLENSVARYFSDIWNTIDLTQDMRKNLYSGKNVIHNASTAVRTSELQKLKQRDGYVFSSDLFSTEDFDLWVRLAELGDAENRDNFGFADKILGYYRVGHQQLTGNADSNMETQAEIVMNRHSLRKMTGKQPTYVLLTDGCEGGAPFNYTKQVAEALFRQGAKVVIGEQTTWYADEASTSMNFYEIDYGILTKKDDPNYWAKKRNQGVTNTNSIEDVFMRYGQYGLKNFLTFSNQWGRELPLLKSKGANTLYLVHSLLKYHEDMEGVSLDSYMKQIQTDLLQNSDQIVTLSPTYASIVKQYFPEYASKVIVNPFGIDTNILKSPSSHDYDPNNVTFFGVGRLDKAKGWMDMVEVMSRITAEKPNTQLIIAGEGPFRADLEARINELGLGSNIHLVGQLDRQRLVELYKSSDIMVHPTWHENWSLAVTDAVNFEKPLMVSQVGSLVDMFDNGIDALCLSPRNHNEWELQMKWAIDHPSEMVRMASNMQADWRNKRYTVQEHAQRYLALTLPGYSQN
jgi:glycosyltransferase involved in cell wall biosynthesis